MIEVMFDCKECGARHERVSVPARTDPVAMDVVQWMNDVVMPRVMRAHTLRSLLCESPKVDLYLPAPPNAEWIGQEVK